MGRSASRGPMTAESCSLRTKAHFWWPGPRLFVANGNGHYRIEQRFKAYDGEKLFGLGQHLHGRLDQKGLVIDLVQRNAEVSIPFMVSSRGYGFLWNSPAVGRVELAANGTRWVADSARQVDYWVTAGDNPAEILSRYADATGHVPKLPSWASGFWQSKLRYRTQEELLGVAGEYHRRGVPLAVIVSDFLHWEHIGDWSFDATEWPDPTAMVSELELMGTKLMVSVWPCLTPLSVNYKPMLDRGLLISSEQGPTFHATWPERGVGAWVGSAFYDATNPEAREYIWQQIENGYYKAGVRVFWLDACEPEIKPGYPGSLRFAAGPGLEVANLYPREHARGFYEGMVGRGEEEILTLVRSAWAGSQRYGAALWSGDTPTTFDSLGVQVRGGLNVAMSGMPWWTTDIGGFFGGDPDDPGFRELFVRWFQYGAFCPIFRSHGDRKPQVPMGSDYDDRWTERDLVRRGRGVRHSQELRAAARAVAALSARPGRRDQQDGCAHHAPAPARVPRRRGRLVRGRPVHVRSGSSRGAGARAGSTGTTGLPPGGSRVD